MKYKRHISILLTMVMLLSILSPVGTISVSAKEGDTTPLQLEKLTPETKVSMDGIEEELSLTFNQPVTILEGKQIQLLYDKEGDGKPDDPVLVQEEPEEGQDIVESHDGIGGDKGEYVEMLSIDKEDSNKVLVNLTYGEQSLLEDDHVYQLNIYEVIKVTDHEETFAGLGLDEKQESWIFDTQKHKEVTSIEITGEDHVILGESTSLKATVKNQYDNTLLKEAVQWSSSDKTFASVDKNTGEVTGINDGKVAIIVTSTTKDTVKASMDVTIKKTETEQKSTVADSIQPLALVSHMPEHQAQSVKTTGEISLIFNQPVELNDVTPQVGINYDSDGDGEIINDSGILGYYDDVLKIDPENSCKVILEINDQLEANHVYEILVNTSIKAVNGGEVYEGLNLNNQYDWYFDTRAQAQASSIEITGKDSLQLGDKTILSAIVKDADGDTLEEERVEWSCSDDTKAVVDPNTGEVTGGGLGKVTITATSISNGEITATKEMTVEKKPLVLVSHTPEHKAHWVKTTDEISLTFNQPVELNDITPQVGVNYDSDGDGEIINDSGVLGYYDDVLKIDPEDPCKLILEINDQLEANHVYEVLVNTSIQSVNGGEVFEGLNLNEEHTWVFDTHIQTGQASGIEITGDSAVQVGNKLTLTANAKDAGGNILHDQDINWSTADVGTATVEKKTVNTAEITGVATGKVIITASLASNSEVKATLEITVGDALDYGLMVKQSMQLSSKRAVEVRGVSMYDGVVHAIVQDKHDTTTKLYAFDLYGHELWKTSLDAGSSASKWTSVPVYDQDGTIYVQYTKLGGKTLIYAIQQDGTVKWKKDIDETPSRSTIGKNTEPVILENQLIFTVGDGIYSLNTQSADVRWHKGINGEGLSFNGENHRIETSPVAYGNMIYVAIKGENTSVKDDKIQAYDANGNEKWHYISPEGMLDPLIRYGTVYVVDDKGKVVALAPGDGSPFTSNSLNGYQIEDVGSSKRGIVGSDSTLYIEYENLKAEGRVVAINSNGTQKYSYTTTGNGINEVDDAGYLYYTGGNSERRSTIYAVDPYGKLADSIPGYDSTLAGYSNIKIYGNVLLGSRNIYGQFIVAKIQRDVPEIPQSIEFIQQDKTLGVNIQDTLPVVVKNTAGEVMIADELEWSSSDASVLSVVDGTTGTFKGIKAGTPQVTVKVKDHPEVSKTLSVTVEEKQSVPTTVEILSKDGTVVDNAIEVEYKVPYLFTYQVKDQYGIVMEEETTFWQTSLNLNKVTVDQDGLFHPESTGAFPLAAVSNQDANIRKDITVNIKKEASTFGGILPKEIVLTLPGSVQLKPSNQYGEPFTLEGVTWISGDESIAKVDETGVVTATGYGTTTITATKESDSFTKEIHVVDAFGYEWNREYNQVEDNFAEDPEANIYYSIMTSDYKYQLVSTKPDGSEIWNVSLDGKNIQHIQWVEDSLYCITGVSGGNRYLTKVNPKTGKEIWNFKLGAQGINNIQEGENDNIYVAENNKFYSIDKRMGIEKWSQAIDGTLYNYTIDDDGMIYMPVYKSSNTQIMKVRDEGNKGTILETTTLEGVQFITNNSNLVLDKEGTLYGYFSGTINDLTGTGVCAVKDGIVAWSHFFSNPYSHCSTVPKIVRGEDGTIYCSSFYPNSSKEMSKFYAIDQDGNLKWEKELTDLTESGKTMYASGDFEVDDSGNIYIPMMQYASGTIASREKSILVKINPEGSVTRYLSYNMDKYGRFDYIHMSDSGIYLTGLYEKYVIKLTHENTQTQVPDEIHLKAARSSIVKGDYLDIAATVYSQVGIAMDNEKVSWTSSKPDIAKVDEKGKVTGLAVGTTVITVSSDTNPEVKATYDITVIDAGANYITRDKLEEHIQDMLGYYKKSGINADWAAFGVSALGEDINNTDYATNNKTYMGKLWDLVSASESLGAMTEYERMTLAILSGGYDPTNFGGMNLIEKIYNYKDLSQGNNAVMWGLIALDAANAEVPESGKYSQEILVDYLLSHRAGLGWSFSGTSPDIDMTAMAIYSLAPYYNGWEDYKTTEVKTAVDEAVTWLKTKQQEKGGFNYTGANITNTESTAQVIMALTSIGIDPQGDEFARSEGNLVSAMLSNQMADGTFMHEADIGQSDSMATSQALQALAALKRFNEKGYSDIFYHIGAEEPIEVEDWMELITDINKLPEDITLAEEDTVQQLRARYDALGEDKEKITNLDTLTQAEEKIAQLKADQQAAKEIEEQIKALSEEITLQDKNKVEEARSAYTNLTEGQKALVTNLEKLAQAEAKIATLTDNQEAADSVIAKINELPTSITLIDKAVVEAARAAYTALTEDQRALVTNLDKLTSLEEKISQLEGDKAAADIVIAKINELPTSITLTDKAVVEAARAAYTALTEEQKTLVTNLDKLTTAEEKISQLEGDKSAADSVITKINELPTSIALTDKGVVEAARTAYTALTVDQRALITNLSTLIAAEEKITQLEGDQGAANSVIEKINALPENITLEDKGAVELARAAYTGLTLDQRALITNIKKLTSAEEKIKELTEQKDKEAAKVVEENIQALPENITLTDKSKVQEARNAYTNLTQDQKALVTNLDKLAGAEARIASLMDNGEAADNVIKKINELPTTITLADKAVVEAARATYTALTSDQKDLITNLDKLSASEEKIKNLEADQDIAQKVIDEINNLPEKIVLTDKAKVTAARSAYAALSEAQQAFVTNLEKLTEAEKTIKNLEATTAKQGTNEEKSTTTKDKKSTTSDTGDTTPILGMVLLLGGSLAGLYNRRKRQG